VPLRLPPDVADAVARALAKAVVAAIRRDDGAVRRTSPEAEKTKSRG
jgi:hypothetical protein